MKQNWKNPLTVIATFVACSAACACQTNLALPRMLAFFLDGYLSSFVKSYIKIAKLRGSEILVIH